MQVPHSQQDCFFGRFALVIRILYGIVPADRHRVIGAF